MMLRGVTLVYGPPGAGKTTFAAWYTYNSYDRVFWVSAFEDEETFRRNMAALGYNFGGKLVYWEAVLAGAEAFFNTLLDAVAREKPQALVIDSVTEFLAAGGGLDILHNIIYRAVKQSGVDVFLTAEREVAQRVAYVADNVIELFYEVYPYGAVREAVVRKIRGGRAGYTMPYVILEGAGLLFIAPSSVSRQVERLETLTCIDEVVGGIYKGLLHAFVGPPGAGKTWHMLNVARSLRDRGVEPLLISISGAGSIYAEKFGVETIDVGLDLGEFYAALATSKAPVIFIRGLETFSKLYGIQLLYTAVRTLLKLARTGRAVVVSLRDLYDLDVLFDVIVKIEDRAVTGVRAPGGKIGERVRC
ncbi:RAD55 family ATPase [Pyrobaculum neutrophilum]|nr:ATPase domain-containing protein [Pyrobaculum neutrophilum]